jgi:Icc protein
MDRFIQGIVLAFLFMTTGCSDMNEYSPNQIHDNDSPKALNEKSLLKLRSTEPDDTLTIVFAGDSQQFYDELDLFVDKVNSLEAVDFTLIAGDISDFGLLEEFEWITQRLQHLRKPYFGVIGNHDIVANGEAVFKEMFGPLNFSFVYDSVKFVLHNTNSREYLGSRVPDLVWMEKELLLKQDDVKNYIGVSHVPPFSGDFNPALEKQYAGLLKATPGFLVSLHGHIHAHQDGYPYDDGIRYITSYSVQQRNLIVLKIFSGNVVKTIIPY